MKFKNSYKKKYTHHLIDDKKIMYLKKVKISKVKNNIIFDESLFIINLNKELKKQKLNNVKSKAKKSICKKNKIEKKNQITMSNASEGFAKFKKRIIKEKIIKALTFSLSIGIICFSLPLLYYKIKEIEVNLLSLILIAIGISILLFGLLYFIIKPSDKKIAKRLDKELDLKEKVQTMYEYKDERGIIVDIQRENTNEILKNTPLKNLVIKFGVVLIAVIVISLSLCVTAIAYPTQENNPITEPTKEPEKTWESDDWTIQALIELIEYVKESDIDNNLKNNYVNLLTNLVENIENIKTEKEIVSTVIDLISKIELELDKINTNNEIYEVLLTSESSKVTDLGGQINFLNPEKVKYALENLIILIAGNTDAIIELDEDFRKILKDSLLNKNDPLYIELYNLSENLYKCQTEANVNEAVKKVVKDSIEVIIPIIKEQKKNKDTADYVKNQLIIIFNLEDKFKNEIDSGNEGEGATGNTGPSAELPNNGSGGLGDGEFIVGSDDLFFDPDKGTIKYGEVIEKYYGTISGMFNDGKLPKEYEEYFKNYFNLLFGVYDDTNDSEE